MYKGFPLYHKEKKDFSGGLCIRTPAPVSAEARWAPLCSPDDTAPRCPLRVGAVLPALPWPGRLPPASYTWRRLPWSFSPGLPGSPASLHREIQAAFFLTTAAGCSSAQISRFLALVCLLYWGASSPEPQSSPWVGWRRGNLRVQHMIFNRLGDRVKRGCFKRNPYFPHSASYKAAIPVSTPLLLSSEKRNKANNKQSGRRCIYDVGCFQMTKLRGFACAQLGRLGCPGPACTQAPLELGILSGPMTVRSSRPHAAHGQRRRLFNLGSESRAFILISGSFSFFSVLLDLQKGIFFSFLFFFFF